MSTYPNNEHNLKKGKITEHDSYPSLYAFIANYFPSASSIIYASILNELYNITSESQTYESFDDEYLL